MVLVGQGVDHVADVLAENVPVPLVDDFPAESVVDPELEVDRERIPVAEDVLHDAPVCRRDHRAEAVMVPDFIDVRPCGEVYI